MVWVQKISIPAPRRELEIPGGGGGVGVKGPGILEGRGGWRLYSCPDGRKLNNSLYVLTGTAPHANFHGMVGS